MSRIVLQCAGVIRIAIAGGVAIGACGVASACHSASGSGAALGKASTAASRPQIGSPVDAGPKTDLGSPSVSARLPEETAPGVAPQADVAENEDVAVEARFALPLSPGTYTFPDGLRVRFSATHECEYDSTAPCSPWDVTAWFNGRETTVNVLSGKRVRVAGHWVEVVDQALVVRK